MVLSRNDKRKRKEGDLVDLMGPLSESPKRTKVHAQRKFAQGSATVFSPTHTPVKEKEKTKPAVITELITHKRPNTEDFLTFLCFRGTSILPPSLNFFNVGPKKEKSESKLSTATVENSPSSSSASTPLAETAKPNPTKKIQANKSKNVVPEKKKVSNRIQKNITKYKSTSSTVQALKKKYQEQRLAKQRIKNKFKASCVIRTRSSTERAIIKSNPNLPSRKYLSTVETKRLGLRSSANKSKKVSLTKSKGIPAKPKKRPLVKEKSHSSNVELSSDEEVPSTRSMSQAKRSLRTVSKKICTRSKSELRRVTRSHSEISSQSLSRRPSRKTKEAAAVYMEILGRKLVSPDLENDDNLSVDSFPELPNARRIAQTESEIKAKVRQVRPQQKETKNEGSNSSNRRPERAKPESKVILKNKRVLRVRKYCEIDSDEESISSEETGKAGPITRRSVGKGVQPPSRSLRSSSRNVAPKSEVQTSSQSSKDKEKIITKRKKEQLGGKETNKETVKGSAAKTKVYKSKVKSTDSEEETLGMLLDKLKKKKSSAEAERESSLGKSEAKEENRSAKETPEIKIDLSKVSDDEESFRGFTKKAISKVLNSCHSHVNANLLASEEADGKLDAVKSQAVPQTNVSESKEKLSLATDTSIMVLQSEAIKHAMAENSMYNDSYEALAAITSKPDKKYSHEVKSSTVNIIDMPLSSAHGRKERVNMSTEQIEKWLNESSMAKEESKVEMETVSNFRYEVSEKVKSDSSHLSISTKIQHLVRPVNVTLSKISEKNTKEKLLVQAKPAMSQVTGVHACAIRPQSVSSCRSKNNSEAKEVAKRRCSKGSKDFSYGDDSDAVSKSDQNSTDGSPEKKPLDKRIGSPRKPFQPKVKERKVMTPSANAFSPENESSVYAFESDTETPVSTPFRRKLRDNSKLTEGNSSKDLEVAKPGSECSKEPDNEVPKIEKSVTKVESSSSVPMQLSGLNVNKIELPKCFANLTHAQVLPLNKLTTNWSNVNCSSSIAVQVNLDEQTQEQSVDPDNGNLQKSTEISTQTDSNNDNDDDNDGQLFYIPLQAMTRNGPNLVQGQQLIQGVAVKLGTEGPTGPNQRVLLRAKLVTKPPVTVARCPPIGTVQPTTRTPPSAPSSIDQAVPSTSTAATSASIERQSPVNKTTGNVQANQHNLPVGPAVSDKVNRSPKMTRERKASIDSSKSGKRSQMKPKQKMSEICSPSNDTTFPSIKDTNTEARLVEAPTFRPTEKDFQDPLEYIDKIRPVAEKFGICRVVPPQNFKPECKVSDDMRFTAYNQYVHRMLHRWGPNVKEMMAIKKYLATQSITLTHPPWIGGMEVDLPHLYQTVQSLGGLKEVIEKKKWQKVADGMKIPKSAQDRVTKLDDIYCKYLLPYDTLSPEEREKLFDEVETEWAKRESKALERLDTQSNDDEEDEDDSSDEMEECIVKGRNMPLNAFYRIARNTQRMWFGENQRSGSETEGASADEVETAFWKHVAERKRHVCVHAASIDSSGRGFGFSVAKNSPFARHPWNLKVLTNNAGSVLRALGPLMGVTVPTLHVGMLFSACCWYRDPHGLPWIEYLHTGAKKIWYGIPDEHNYNFKKALAKMVPRYCKNKTIWLPSDTAMVPPETLVSNGVSLCQTVQEPGQFIVVFPKAFTSSICTGYVVSESVYFAHSSWLETAEQVFKDIHDSCEPSIFSFERLLISIINDTRSHIDVLKQILPTVMRIRDREIDYRRQLQGSGLLNTEKLPLPDSGKGKKGKRVKEDDGDFECETCRANLFVSLVNNSQDDSVYCLPHALQLISRKKNLLKSCTLMYTYSEDELDELIQKLEDRIEAKSRKTNQIRQSK
ncbi:protein Jumonji [Orussus abietinus]|uniref:protein Jumonji n=1 Tax=Orussus abietinus TaxID=222816 RepID=UPI0006267811|nr:protein Jumonji [Orussus abietinus]XP_012286668.1 protein Jumonji [Orussus abietinus]XP_012286669.1 protein Jumonji [Orussus abietinus]XP_023290133.1 protein Jumonji [Orussus abietinus]